MSRPMRIAFVYDALFPYVKGGAERRYHELARRLATEHEVHHVTWRWWDGPATTTLDGITLHGVGTPPKLYGTDGKRTVREAAAFAARITPLLLRNRFDVIDCSATPYVPLYAAAAAARLTRTPLVATWHEFWGEHWAEYLPYRPAIARAAQALESRARRLGSAVVAVSPFTLRRMGLAASDRTRVVPNGIDAAAWGDVRPRTTRRPEWDLAFVGRLIDEKRVDRLLNAIHELRRTDLRCAIVGDGPARGALVAQAEALGIAELVHFLGAIGEPEARTILTDAELFLMPSEREGFGITVLEAQLAGAVPVVVRGPHTAAADLVRDGTNGVVCDPDPVAIAGAIAELLADRTRVAGMRSAGRAAAQRFDWDEIADQMLCVYRVLGAHATALATGT